MRVIDSKKCEFGSVVFVVLAKKQIHLVETIGGAAPTSLRSPQVAYKRTFDAAWLPRPEHDYSKQELVRRATTARCACINNRPQRRGLPRHPSIHHQETNHDNHQPNHNHNRRSPTRSEAPARHEGIHDISSAPACRREISVQLLGHPRPSRCDSVMAGVWRRCIHLHHPRPR